MVLGEWCRRSRPTDRRRRAYQPVVKTRERVFPLIPELANQIYNYVIRLRNKIPRAKKHGYLFITHKSGVSQGLPLSNAGFGKFMGMLLLIEGMRL